MIAKGNLHANGRKLAAYLVTGKKDERAELVEMRGFAADTLRDAFTDVQIQAEGTRATKPFFHCYVRLPEGEGLERDQWRQIADRIEQKLGLDDQPRAVAFHHGPDGTHMHMAWSRIDLETMRAIDPGLYKNKLKEVCRELETELGLTPVSNDRQADDKTLAAGENEFEEARRLGTDLKATRNAINECWQAADSGKAFAAALDEHGLMLARGDKRAFVVIDQEGGIHALGKRITGATAAVTRERLGDLDSATLPSVAEARSMQQEQQARRKATGGLAAIVAELSASEGQEMVEPDTDRLAAQQAQREAALLEEAELQRVKWQFAAQASQTTQRSEQAPPEQARPEDQAAKQPEREAELLKEAERQEAARKALLDEAERIAKEARRTAAERMSSGEVTDSKSRYAEALGEHYDMMRPYQSLARAAMAEYGKFAKEQEALRQTAAKEADPEQRQLIELRRQIEAAEYMASTSLRCEGLETLTRTGKGAREDEPRGVPTERQTDHKTPPDFRFTPASEWADRATKLREQRAKALHQRDEGQRAAKPAENDERQEQDRKRHNENVSAPGANPTNRAEQKPYDAKTATPAEQKARVEAEMARFREQRARQQEARQQRNTRGGGNSL